MLHSIDLKAEALRIVDTILEGHRLHGTYLCSTIIDGKKSEEPIIKDLGDYLPFFLYFGYTSYCRQHVRDITSQLHNGLLPAQSKLFRIRVTSTYDHSDYLLGLMDYLNYVTDPEIETSLKLTLEAVWRKFFDRRFPSSYISAPLGVALPFFDTKDGMYMEIFADYYKTRKEDKFRDRALSLWRTLQKVRAKSKVQLLPVLVRHQSIKGWALGSMSRIRAQSHTIRVMKNNTNSLFGALSLFEIVASDEIARSIREWVEALTKYMITREGMVYNFGKLKDGSVSPFGPNLTAAFAVIDLLCDLSRCFDEERYLGRAEIIAKFWLSLQGKTGLFPLEPNGRASYLDSETDMIVALQKLHDLSGDPIYAEAAQRTFEGILKYHKRTSGYVLSVDTEKGDVVDGMLKTKFICLLLKVFILFLEGGSVYRNEDVFKLLRDR